MTPGKFHDGESYFTPTKSTELRSPRPRCVPSAPMMPGEDFYTIAVSRLYNQSKSKYNYGGVGQLKHSDDSQRGEPYMDTGDKWHPVKVLMIDYEEPEFGDDMARCRTIWNHFNYSMLLTMLVALIITAIIGAINGVFATLLLITFGTAFGIFYIVYVIENFTSSTAHHLSRLITSEESESKISAMQNATPSLRFHIECYHYEQRPYTSTNSDGKEKTKMKEIKVNTWKKSEKYHFDCWQDCTKLPNYEDLSSLTEFQFHESYGFADDYTQNHYELSKQTFLRNNNRDDHYDFHVTYDIPNFIDSILVATESDPTFTYNSFCFSVWTFWSPFYRFWFSNDMKKQKIEVRKVIQTFPPMQFRGSHTPPVKAKDAQRTFKPSGACSRSHSMCLDSIYQKVMKKNKLKREA